MALKQILSQKQEQRLSPQQIQLMKLLQVPTSELEERIKQELEDNPTLEEGKEDTDDRLESDEIGDVEENDKNDELEDFDPSDYMDTDTPDYKTQVNNRSKDDEERVIPYSGEQSFQDYLLEQLYLLSLNDTEKKIAQNIIGNLDESGYLGRDTEAIVDDMAFSMNVHVTKDQVETVLAKVQQLDPAGVGARDLRECLILQLEREKSGDITRFTAKKILQDCFEEVGKRHYDKILKKLNIEDEDLKDALEVITKLNPKPGGSGKTAGNSIQITPDFFVQEFDGKLEVTLNGRNMPELRISREYATVLLNHSDNAKLSKSDKDAFQFIKQKLDSAKWFIDAIKQRQATLLTTMEAIVVYQRDFFITGDETDMKPMILKDISDKIGLDISTISRVSNSKYVQTNFGVFPLKYFFSEALSTDSGEEVSTREVKRILQDAVDNENKRKPLTDDKLATLLNEQGYNIARRTIAKYREQLNIPVARLRKEL